MLRLAYPVNPSEKAAADPVLEELLSWAATVVKLPGGTIVTPSLARDIVEFPSEFLIFSPHVSRLEFQDRVSGISRDIELRKDGHLLELTEAGRLSQWRLFENALRPSPAARQDAGELADRGSIPVMWAVQTRGRREDGSFWAFFPTEYRTTLSGIVNAPWKTNEDRQNLLRGPFNEELIDSASALIARSIPEVFDPDDPGRHLDLMPARASDARNWADVRLMSGVYDQLVRHVSLPDQEGELRLPAELHLHPQGIPPASLERWSQSRHRPVDWVHPATNTRERRPRVERLMGEERAAATMTRWLEAILDGDDLADRSRDAVAVAASLVGRVPRALIRDVRSAAIVLTSDGRLLSPDSAELFLPGLHDLTVGVALVDHRLADDAATCAALEDLGVQRVDTARELEALVSRNLGDWSDRDWEQFWLLAREVPVTQSAPMIRKRRSRKARRPVDHDRTFSAAAAEIRVRTLDGRYRPINRVLLPGRIVPPDGGHDAALAVDIDFHEGDLELIRALGGTDCPEVWDQAESEAWFREFQSSEARKYEESLDPGHSIPREGYLAFESVTTIGPLAPLSELTEEGRANFTMAALESAGERPAWHLAHLTSPASYPRREVPDPIYWMVRRDGRLRTSLGIRSIDHCAGPGLESYSASFPAAKVTDTQALRLRLPQTLAELSPCHWRAALVRAEQLDDDGVLGDFLAVAAQHVPAPGVLPCRRGGSRAIAPPADVLVAVDRQEFEALAETGAPRLLVRRTGDHDRLINAWGLRSAGERLQRSVVVVPVAPAHLLIDDYPGLRWLLADAPSWRIQRCSELRHELLTESGRSHVPGEIIVRGEMIYVAKWLDEATTLTEIARELALGLSAGDIEEVLASRQHQRRQDLVVAARNQSSDADRLLAVVGVDAIERQLPRGLLDAVLEIHDELSDRQLGVLALATFGTDALQQFKSTLQAHDLGPPGQWAGSAAAVTFVRELGFDAKYAGAGSLTRKPTVVVDGPFAFPDLHDFQRELADRIRSLLLAPAGERRALLSLPTGAGKTRIAVQAIVEAVRDGEFDGPLLWVADRDELCEQAVQSWIDVWRSIGPPEQLHVSRLWSGNETAPVEDGVHVIVATIQKLRNALEDPTYQWLSEEVRCLVVDEAHSSTSSEYTDLLQRVGLGRSQARDEAVLLGLTATPFRGVNERETDRLAARYGRERLDAGVLGTRPEVTLQEMGVLSGVRHQLLQGDDIELTAEQAARLSRFRRLPAEIEERLGTSVRRNRVLLDSVCGLPADWPVLFFATSVAHAQTMAALFTLAGIPSAAVSAETPAATRRSYIERFRRGELRVLTNYGVLTQGFDAPAVRALYIARPTYSPNLYQQMIGRGLRGPLNGGKEECLVVNVADNILQFGEQLAFHHFDYLWNPRE